MNKKYLLFLVFIGLMATNGFVIYQNRHIENPTIVVPAEKEPPPPEISPQLRFEQALQTINVEEAKEKLFYLASDELEGRMSGKRGNETAADFIENEFKIYGLETGRQRFKIQRINPGPKNEIGKDYTENIYGILRGKSNKHIIVGAHMDHIGYGPEMSMTPRRREIHNGADDNASGSVIIMSIAKAMSYMDKPNYTYIFICFSAEEMGLIGAAHYVKDPVLPLSDDLLMINFDMVGYLRGTLNAYGASKVPVFDEIVKKLDQKYSEFNVNINEGSGGSDHAIFSNRAKKPIIFFHTGGHPYYHTPDDDAERINYEGLVNVGRFAFEMIWEFDQSGKNMVFKAVYNGSFLDESHDHGIKEIGVKNEKPLD